MKKLELVIESKYINKLQTIADEIYLYDYIVNNETELYSDSVFRNPSSQINVNNFIIITKENMSSDDEYVVNETIKELKHKNIQYYAVIKDSENESLLIYQGLRSPILSLGISPQNDDIENIKRLEEIQENELINYEELEM